MRILTGFATFEYRHAMERLEVSAQAYFDLIEPHYELPPEFMAKHAGLFRFARGHGFWVWKPWLILDHLRRMRPGDVLMYCDSQLVFTDDPAPLFKLCREQDGVLLFHQKREGHRNRTYTKRDAFRLMECDSQSFWDGPQLNTAMSVWAATPKAIGLAEEWYGWCADHRVVSDEISKGGERPGFKDHRHDQSILSLLAIRDGLETFPDPSQFGNGYAQPGRDYGQVLEFRRFVDPPYTIPCRSSG